VNVALRHAQLACQLPNGIDRRAEPLRLEDDEVFVLWSMPRTSIDSVVFGLFIEQAERYAALSSG